jgi:methylphosphotriester-DNA--protein-cysteine methyltransferase
MNHWHEQRKTSVANVLRTIERHAKRHGLSLAVDAARVDPEVIREQLQSMHNKIWRVNGSEVERRA